jgi:hypothetical protein
MTKDQLIDKILSDLYMNSNRGMDFFDDFSVYENDINKLEAVKTIMEKEGLITTHKNLKTGISPIGFKICFEGGYLEEKNRKERLIKKTLRQNKVEITYLKMALRTKNRSNSILTILLLITITVMILMTTGIINFRL